MKAIKVMTGSKRDLQESGKTLKDIEEARESFTGFDPEDPPPSIGHESLRHPNDGGVLSDHRRLYYI